MSLSMDHLSLVPGDRSTMISVPTKQGMTNSSTCYVSSVRTTLCDIMCTVNASVLFNVAPPADKLKPLTAKLPYGKSGNPSLKKKIKHATLFQDMIMGENQHRVEKELRKDRAEFFAQLKQEKMEVDRKRNMAAVKIQALFRGYRKRPHQASYIRKRKRRRVHTQNDMQDELCTLAAKLGLKPIDGLSLETRSKTSRRKERIMNAAAFRLHRFFAMILQRGRARRRLEDRREEIVQKCARIITRAVRYVKVRKFVKKCENIKRQQMALKIQCRTRIFHAREKVRVYAKRRHQRAKEQEAAIIIQRNLAPKNRAYNLARLTMVTMRTYIKIADDVVNFIMDFLLEGGISSVVDIFTAQISDKFEVVYPQVEERIEENLINEAVVIEMHIWLEEQMLAMLAENQRLSEEKKRLEELGSEEGSVGADGISWNSLSAEFLEDLTSESAAMTPVRTPARSISPIPHMISRSTEKTPVQNVGGGSGMNSQDASRRDLLEPHSHHGSVHNMLAVAPSVLHRARFVNVRGSLSGMATGSFSLHSLAGGTPGASFAVSAHQYKNAMNRLSSVDMTHSVKFHAALLAANFAANESFDGSPSRMSDSGTVEELDNNREDSPAVLQKAPSFVRFSDEESKGDASSSSNTSPLRSLMPMDPLTPQDSRKGLGLMLVAGIAEGDEDEDDESVSIKAAGSMPPKEGNFEEDDAESVDTASKHQSFKEEPLRDASQPALESEPQQSDTQRDAALESENYDNTNDTVEDTMDTATAVTGTNTDFDDQSRRRSVTSEFAEAFASMSITSVLNAFGESLVLGPVDASAAEDEEESASIVLRDENHADAAAVQESPRNDETLPNNSEEQEGGGGGEDEPQQHSNPEADPAEEYSVASDIEENYYDKSLAGSIDSVDAVRHVEEWEVCRDFTSMSLTEPEKREIDQLFKDAMYAFHKARYQRASDVLENFLPILHKFPSSDPFHPDVARVQTTIKTIKARILFETAQYADAKEVLDDALQHRIEVFGKAHYLCVELYYFIGEWHRSQAEYDIAEKYLHQAAQSVTGLIKMQQDASGAASFDIKLWNAKNKVLVAQAELCKQCGQYYKANRTIMQVQESLRQFDCQDSESLRIQESFVCCWVSALTINGKYAQSVALHQELLDKRRLRYGTSHPKIATSLCALGTLQLLRSEHAQAIEMLDESLAMRRQSYPADHPAIAASLYAKGVAFALMGMYPEAATDMTHSLEMRRLKLGTSHPSVAQSASALAVIQTQMGDPLRAWKNHNFALEIFRARYGVDKHRDIADALFNMACNAEMRGSYLEAVAYHEQALQLKEAIMQLFRSETMGAADLHLGLELSRVHLARCYALVSRLDEAKAMLKDAVKKVTKILGNRSDHVAHSLCCLGELCKIRGNYADAKQLYALAFNITQELFGDDHPLIATTMLLSSENLRIPGMYADAMELENSAYDVRSYLFGSDNVFTGMAVYQRAQLLRDSGKLSEAEKQYLRAMHFLIAKLGENSGLYGVVLGDYAECCRLSGKLDVAEKYFTQAIQIQKGSHGESSLQINETICNFTLLLMDLHHPGDAAQILHEKVVPTFETLLGRDHPITMYAKANLALSSQFVRFFMSQGTEEGSVILESVLGHPDIATFLEACQASSFAADHPWLLRFSEGSQSFATATSLGTPTRTPLEGLSEAGDNNSVQSSVTGYLPTGSVSIQSVGLQQGTEGPQSLEGTNSLTNGDSYTPQSVERTNSLTNGETSYTPQSVDRTNSVTNGETSFTPRGASLESRQASLQTGDRSMFSPTSDSDTYSVHSYGDNSNYTPSDAGTSVANSMSYSMSNASSATQSRSQSYVPYTQRTDYSSRLDRPSNSISESDNESSFSQSNTNTGSGMGYLEGSQQSGAYFSSRAPRRAESYQSQHSAVLEYGDDYSASSASLSYATSLTPRDQQATRNRRNFSLTPASSTISRNLRNFEESSLGSWNHGGDGDEQVSLDDYFSRSQTLGGDDESVGTMESLYRD